MHFPPKVMRSTVRFAALAILIATAGCQDSNSPVVATTLTLATAPSTPVRNRVPFATQPVIRLTGAGGRGSATSGVVVTATLKTAGATLIGGTTATTNESGVATFTDLAVAGVLGAHEIEFTAPSLASVTTSVNTTPGLPASILLIAGGNQTALVNTPVTIPLSIKVVDADGNAVPNVPVTFSVAAGGGALTGATQTTGVSGIATLPQWTLGPSAGTNSLTVNAEGLTGNPLTVTAVASTSDFDIELVFLTSVTAGQRAAFESAVSRWRRVITGDLGNEIVQTTANSCVPAINAEIDDVRIYVKIENIDGPGNVLGSAGPCFIRDVSLLTVVGAMRFDSSDLTMLEGNGRLTDVILHEMGHVLGIGSLWQDLGLLTGAGSSDPFFTGAEAIARFNSIGGGAYNGNKVPVENTGGGGTAGSHWRESVFNNELMTGFLNAGSNPMSVVTIGSLKDLGYTVSFAPADNYTFIAGAALSAPTEKIKLEGDVLQFTPQVIPRKR